MTKDNFYNKNWQKNWSGNWSLLFATFYADVYTRGLYDFVGKKFSNNLIIFESGVSANFLLTDELEEYCEYVKKLIIDDNDLPEKWIKEILSKTDEIFVVMRALNKKNIFTEKDYKDLQEARALITAPNFTIKKVIDYLPDSLVTKFLKKFSDARVYTEPVYNETDRVLKKIVSFLLPEYSDNKLLSVITQKEMEEFFTTKKVPSLVNLEQRYDKCAFFYDGSGDEKLVVTGKDFDQMMTMIAGNRHGSEIKGMSAYKGVVKGKVQIVLDPSKADNFQKGDILVSGMTRPEYLHLMERAGGFVTDAGGLLSHAAIVARELKKPCIVGTNSATKVLKDGDLVEVDANKGIVRIIKRV